jgi:hypothetical protein
MYVLEITEKTLRGGRMKWPWHTEIQYASVTVKNTSPVTCTADKTYGIMIEMRDVRGALASFRAKAARVEAVA